MTDLKANTAASKDAGNCLMAWLYSVIAIALASLAVATARIRTIRLYAPTTQQIQIVKKLTQSVVLSIIQSVIATKHQRHNKNAPKPFTDHGAFGITAEVNISENITQWRRFPY
jgi:uncharacterized membrane protein